MLRDTFELVAYETDTRREVWRVYIGSDRGPIVHYAAVEVRASTRHKWKVEATIYNPTNIYSHRNNRPELPQRLVSVLASAMHAEVDSYTAKLLKAAA